MLSTYQWSLVDLIGVLLVWLRVLAVLVALPIFGDNPTPVRVRVFLSLALTLVVYPTLPPGFLGSIETRSLEGVTLALCRELVLGISIGFAARIMFEAMIMAANLVGFQMGFGTATLMVADSTEQMTSFTALHRILVLLIFTTLNLHHLFIHGLHASFSWAHAGPLLSTGTLAQTLVGATTHLFVVAVQLAAPVLVGLLFAMSALGLLARAVPQLNVFTLSFPASFFLGIAVYAACLPMFPGWVRGYAERTFVGLLEMLAQVAA